MRPANIYLIEKDWELLIPYIENEKTISVRNDITLHIPVKVSHHSGQTEPPDKERIFKI